MNLKKFKTWVKVEAKDEKEAKSAFHAFNLLSNYYNAEEIKLLGELLKMSNIKRMLDKQIDNLKTADELNKKIGGIFRRVK